MIGAGLKKARIRNGWTLTLLADKVRKQGHPTNARIISEYEKGTKSPSASFLLLAASVLNVPSTYFMHVPEVSIAWRAFRKRSGFGTRRQDAVKQYAADLTELHIELNTLLNTKGNIDFPETKRVTNVKDAEYAAGELRERWNIADGPVHNLVRLAEDRGAIVIAKCDASQKFDGLSGWCDTYPVIVINSSMSTDRVRFTMAHELGHLVMDTSSVEDVEEKLAHRFAAALLVPADTARSELSGAHGRLQWDDLKVLKRKYGLSMSAWVRRAYDLDVINESSFVKYNRDLRRRGWYHNEPGQYDGDEEPTQLERMARHAIAKGAMSVQRLSYSDADFLAPVAESRPTGDFPSATELIEMDDAERECWMTKMFDLADDMEFEVFEAFGEEEF